MDQQINLDSVNHKYYQKEGAIQSKIESNKISGTIIILSINDLELIANLDLIVSQKKRVLKLKEKQKFEKR